MAIETFFKNIADAIRTKGGTIATLTPAQMPQAIADLPSGGGGIKLLTPTVTDDNGGYVNNNYYYHFTGDYLSDIYTLEVSHYYYAFLGNTVGNKFKGVLLSTNPIGSSGNLTGISIGNQVNNPSNGVISGRINPYGDYIYLVINKCDNNVANIPTYVIDVTDIL